MNSQSLIYSALSGFVAGTYLGLRGDLEKMKLNLDFARHCVPLADEEVPNITTAELNDLERKVLTVKISTPFIAGVAATMITSLINDNQVGEGFVSGIPATYVGYLLGKSIWRWKNREKLGELDILKELHAHPERALDYLAPSQRITFEESLGNLEREISAHGPKVISESTLPLQKLVEVIVAKPKLYLSYLVKAIGVKRNETIALASLTHVLQKFYEGENNDCSLLREGDRDYIWETSRARVFTKQGSRLNVSTFVWPSVGMKTKEGGDFDYIQVELGVPKRSDVKHLDWPNNYRGLAQVILPEVGTATPCLIIKVPDADPPDRDLIIAMNFLVDYLANQEYNKYLAPKRND